MKKFKPLLHITLLANERRFVVAPSGVVHITSNYWADMSICDLVLGDKHRLLDTHEHECDKFCKRCYKKIEHLSHTISIRQIDINVTQ